MPIPTNITDLSPAAGSNSPLGSEPPTEGDNHIRALAAFIRQLYDGATGAAYALSADLTDFIADLANTSNVSLGAASIGRGAQVVSSIAALRNLLKTTPSTHAFVTGYYAAGDGGGGPYYYDSSDTTSSDNGGTIIVASDGGRWKLATKDVCISVKQFGAKGDFNGTTGTDDTAAIQAAINWAELNTNTGSFGSFSPSVGTGCVYFPQGCYKVTSPLVVSYKISILGDGQTEFSYGSRIYQDTANTDLFQYNPATGGGTFSIEKMILSTTKGVGTGHLVNVTRSGTPYVNSQRYVDCTFAQPQAMSLLLTGDDIVVENCLFDVSQKSGDCIQLGTSSANAIATNVRIIGCDFFNATNTCLKIINAAGVVFDGNIVSQPNVSTKTLRVIDAITTTPVSASGITISGNMVRGPRAFFAGESVVNVTISGNTVMEGGIGAGEVRPMIQFSGTCVNVNINGNTFRGSYDTTAFYNDSAAAAVSGCISSNTFNNDGGSGDAVSATKLNGRLLSNYYNGFTNRQLGEKRATSGSPVNPGLIAAGGTFGYSLTVQSCTNGDSVDIGTISNAWIAQTGIDVRAFVQAANTVRVEYRNVTGGNITVPAHDIWCEVTR